MEKPEAVGAAGGLGGESPGGASRGALGGVGGVEADAGPPSGAALFHGSEPPLHSGGIVTRSPRVSRPSARVAVPGSGPSQHPGEVAGLSAGSCPNPDGFNAPFPGTSVSGTCGLGSGGSGVYNSGCSPPRSGSTCSHSHKPGEGRPRSILKNSSSILMQKCLHADKKKSQRWDEMNILATYHPADKDYGFMKVDEPSTPYHRLQDGDEDLPGASSCTVTPEALAERFATMDNLYPKVLQYDDNRSPGSSDNFSKTHSSDFEKHRKSHYDEGKFLTAQKNPSSSNKHSDGASTSMGSSSRGIMRDPEPRPAERGWPGGLARGVKDEIGLVTRNHLLEVKDSRSFRNQCPVSAAITSDKEIGLQRKEYYSKGRYLRCSPHPELEEDTEDEHDQQDSESWAGSAWDGGPFSLQTKPCGFAGHKRRKPDNGKCRQLGMGWGPAPPSPHHN
uniref:Protein phosphatase inhibitor 2 n=1 Tax=Canis lupus familiaris TaxID=9615 RepID=A0A8C0Q9R2_CANLF